MKGTIMPTRKRTVSLSILILSLVCVVLLTGCATATAETPKATPDTPVPVKLSQSLVASTNGRCAIADGGDVLGCYVAPGEVMLFGWCFNFNVALANNKGELVPIARAQGPMIVIHRNLTKQEEAINAQFYESPTGAGCVVALASAGITSDEDVVNSFAKDEAAQLKKAEPSACISVYKDYPANSIEAFC